MAPLFFANAELFKERVLDAVAKSPAPVNWLVVAAEPVTSVDVTAADALAELDKTLQGMGIEFCFAELKDPVKDKLKRFRETVVPIARLSPMLLRLVSTYEA